MPFARRICRIFWPTTFSISCNAYMLWRMLLSSTARTSVRSWMIGMSGLDESMTIPATRTRPESSVQVHLTYPAEEELLALIQSAEHSISFAGPGMSTRLATAIVRKDGCVITLTVDLDPEVCRIGFAVS